MQISSDRYYRSPTENNKEEEERNRSKLHEQNNTKMEDLDKMIRQVETADEEFRHEESWRLFNEITGRRTAKKGIIKVKDKEDRINKWYTHFKELLGNEHTVEGELDTISPIL